ncbi:sulfite exporter TauE/SafE family protein [Aurantivibrio infirmus]
MEFIVIYMSAFGIGLLGGMHCIGMCGGISSALGFALESNSRWKRLSILLSYNIGRLFTYSLLGFFVGYASHQISTHAHHEIMPHDIKLARIIAGFLLIAMSLYLAGWWYGLRWLEKIGQLFWKRIQPFAQKLLPVKNFPQAFALGILWGWLPCGLIYSALAYSATQNHPLVSAATMLSFGLGTLPAVLTSGIFAVKIKQLLQKKNLRFVFAGFLFVFGLWTIRGGLPHM